jgi:hypothetical protein
MRLRPAWDLMILGADFALETGGVAFAWAFC